MDSCLYAMSSLAARTSHCEEPECGAETATGHCQHGLTTFGIKDERDRFAWAMLEQSHAFGDIPATAKFDVAFGCYIRKNWQSLITSKLSMFRVIDVSEGSAVILKQLIGSDEEVRCRLAGGPGALWSHGTLLLARLFDLGKCDEGEDSAWVSPGWLEVYPQEAAELIVVWEVLSRVVELAASARVGGHPLNAGVREAAQGDFGEALLAFWRSARPHVFQA